MAQEDFIDHGTNESELVPLDALGMLPSDYVRWRIKNEILEERDRQDKKWGEQNHPVREDSPAAVRLMLENHARDTCEARMAAGRLSWVDILREELEEVNGADNDVDARAELVQLAAVAVAAIECIDRRQS